MIMSDQHTPSASGCYGNKISKTPNLDAMARSGLLFDNAYCNNPVCVPSRMSMLTGLYSHEIDVWHNADALPSQFATWPLVLQTGGYETVISGRNHLLWGSRMAGFSHRLCGDESTFIPHIKKGRTQIGAYGPQGIDGHIGASEESVYAKHDEEANRMAVDYLENATGENPFALFIGYYQPHAPFVAAPEYFSLYENWTPECDLDEVLADIYHPLLKTLQLDREIPREKLLTAIKAYYAMVAHVDDMTGGIMKTLENTGLSDKTIVIYTSDHGEMLGRHRLWHKMCFYEDSARIPMIIKAPRQFAQGEKIKENVSLLDIFPSFVDWAGVECDLSLAGNSLRDCVENGDPMPDRPVITESIGVERGHPGRMVKYGNFKLIKYYQRPPLLFDLENDPDERRDLAGEDEFSEILGKMLEMLNEDWNPDAVNKVIDRNLRHLRYHNLVSLRNRN